MSRLNRIQQISGWLRRLLFVVAVAMVGAIALSVLVPGQTLFILGDGQLNELHASGTLGTATMMALVTPIALAIALGLYWLQRLFGEYQQGRFFTDDTMRCYLWLVWLKVAAFLYSLFWPAVLTRLLPAGSTAEVTLSIDAGTIMELAVMLLIVHLLREAQQINDENQAFV